MRRDTTFGPYRLVRKLGEGGMGEVFLAEHSLIGRRAAIKVLHPDRSAYRENVERFFNEARATSAVSDPGIVQVFDFGVAPDNTAYIVMEFLEGEQLNQRLHRVGVLAPVDALRIVRQVAGSLAATHAVGIVHRDLKPDNLMMVRDAEAPAGERAKILDFGIAKLGDDNKDRFKTRTGAVMGTPVYMSPEQCNDSGKIDHRTDIYSLGCVLFHLLTGRPPFDLEGIGAIISAHLREPPPRPSSIAPHLPPAVDELVLRCLAKSPDDRFASMLDLQRACDGVLAHVSALAAPTIAVPGQFVPQGPITVPLEQRTTLGHSAGQPSRDLPPQRKGLFWIGIGTAAALAVGVGIAIITARSGHDLEPASANVAPTPVEMQAAPVAPAPEPAALPPAAPPPAPTVPVDAAVSETAAAPPIETPVEKPSVAHTVATDRPASKKSHPTAKPKAKAAKPKSEDLYEDR